MSDAAPPRVKGALALRERDRERERAYRKSRQNRLEAMRATAAALERALPVVLTLGNDRRASQDSSDDSDSDSNDDDRWIGFLDDRAVRVRRLLRKSLHLTKEAERLQAAQPRLRDLIHERRIASRVLAGIVAVDNPSDAWDVSVRRWHELARKHFRPWRREDCEKEIPTALREVDAFKWGTDLQTTGASFCGWRDLRRIDATRGVLDFQLHKTFRDDDVSQYVDRVWETYKKSQLFSDVLVGPRTPSAHKLLQRIDDDIMIALASQRNPVMAMDIHMLFIVFRVQIENVITVCTRSIPSFELMTVIDGPRDLWSRNCVWTQWELLEGSGIKGYKYRVGGSIGGNVNYANDWMWEVLSAALRSELFAKRRSLITSS